MESLPLDAAATDFSFVALFLKADVVVKGVMVVLAIASVWSWATIIDKELLFGSLRSKSKRFRNAWARVNSMRALEDLGRDFHDTPYGRVVTSAMSEVEKIEQASGGRGTEELVSFTQRVDRVMGITLTREISKAENGIGVLASVGSASPFIGLFGTVWGIMNSFRAIAVSQDTNLAVVAPGIAEALFATALGLVAAVPAVIFYNKYSTDLANFATDLETCADDLAAILSRRGAGGR